jgi:hypothetical protein
VPDPPRPDPPVHSARVTCHGIIGANNRWANVFWIRNGSQQQPGESDLAWLAGAVYGFYKTRLFLPHTTGCTLQACNVIYYGSGGSQLGADHIENTPSTDPAQVMPANASMCISWKLQQRYKGGHPRTYLPPCNIAHMDDAAHWTDSAADAMRVQADQFHSDINGAGAAPLGQLHLGVVSFVLRNEWRNPPVFRDFTPAAAEVDKRIDSQRRRLGRDL